jgi:hypothetical protein
VLLITANTEHINMFALPLGLGLLVAATRRAGQTGRLAAAGFRRIYFADNSFNIPRSAVSEGIISSEEDLLVPRFYPAEVSIPGPTTGLLATVHALDHLFFRRVVSPKATQTARSTDPSPLPGLRDTIESQAPSSYLSTSPPSL